MIFYSRAQFLLIMKLVGWQPKGLCLLLCKFSLRKKLSVKLKELTTKILTLKMIYLRLDEIWKNVLTKKSYIFVLYRVKQWSIKECFTLIKWNFFIQICLMKTSKVILRWRTAVFQRTPFPHGIGRSPSAFWRTMAKSIPCVALKTGWKSTILRCIMKKTRIRQN